MGVGAVRVRIGRRALAVVLGIVAALLIGGAGTASAHATLVNTDPAQNSVVPTAPSAVTLTFSEGVSLSADSVRVLDPTGQAVDSGDPAHPDGKADAARVGLKSGLANGTYTVAWRAVSEDSHPVGGAFTFSIGAPSDTSVSASSVQGADADTTVAAAYATARTVAYAAFALLAGTAAFVLLCWPGGAGVRQVQRLLMTGWIALLVSTVAVLLLRGPYERGTGISQALDLSLVRSTLDERIGTALAARLLLLAAGGVFLSLLVGQLGQPGQPGTGVGAGSGSGAGGGSGAGAGSAGSDAGDEASANASEDASEEAELLRLERRAAERPLRDARLGLGIAGLVLTVALCATWVGADHSAVGIQVWLALPMAAVHLLAMACWLGGLATLAVGLRHGLGLAAVELFSRIAFGCVTVLSLTGLYQSWRGLGSWSALVDTEYGRLLLIKIGCVAAMVGVAWISRSWIARLRVRPDAAVVADVEEAEGVAGVAGAEGAAVADGAAGASAELAGTSAARRSGEAAEAAERAGSGAGATTGLGEATGPGGATGSGGANGSDADPAREAQLARQRAARADASSRRAKDGTPARAGLRRSVLVESAVAVAVLVVTTMLTNSPPGRVASAVAANGQSASQAPAAGASTTPGRTVELKLPYDTGGRTPNAKGTATVSINPVATGGNAVQLKLDDAAGNPAEVPELELAFTLPDRDLGPLPVPLKAEGTGRWSGTAQLPLAGNWVVSVTVRSSDIDQVTAVQQLKVG
ncbi:FixH family protein [Kitasatospora sp. NPDC094015]|uniref:copper resistance CopC/CopD family protein n=1 Tax=Kitasatospora sp. NPDC094015 TaxID=3155205 RepID=UPI00332930AA